MAEQETQGTDVVEFEQEAGPVLPSPLDTNRT